MLLAEAWANVGDDVVIIYLIEILPMAKSLRCHGDRKITTLKVF